MQYVSTTRDIFTISLYNAKIVMKEREIIRLNLAIYQSKLGNYSFSLWRGGEESPDIYPASAGKGNG